VNPHAFRHARATDLASHLTEQQMKNYLGWTPDSKMCAVYVHNPETENAILKMNGIMIEDTHTDGLRVGRCPRCKELNPDNYQYCGKCGMPLNETSRTKIESNESAVLLEALAQLEKNNPGILSNLQNALNNINH